jgi:hypothetical protein
MLGHGNLVILPGLILAVKSKDDYVSWEALGIRIKTYPILKYPENPFESDKALSCLEFKALYKTKKAIAASKFTTQEGTPIVTARMQIQRYIEEDDKDYTADRALEKERKANN